jgi:hypothetical protein
VIIVVCIHHTSAVANLYEEHDIHTAHYPPNMTAYLQVIDLVVNKPIKDFTRYRNSIRILMFFQSYQEIYLYTINVTERFNHPKPSIIKEVLDLMKLYEEDFGTIPKIENEKPMIMIPTFQFLRECHSVLQFPTSNT